MKAVVLVGGFGTRLRPLTLHTPKQMLPVAGPTMLERVMAGLARHGVDEVVLSLGYRPEAFTAAFPDGRCAGVDLRYAVEPEPLDTAGAIAFAADEAGITERFLALNGDVLTDLDLGALCRTHESSGAAATISLTPVEDPSRYGVVPLHDDGRVQAFIEKPDPGTAPTNWISAGSYVLEPAVLEAIPRGRRVSIEREVFPRLVGDGVLYGFRAEEYWIDAGTPEAYLRAKLDYLDGSRGAAVQGVHRGAHVDPAASVENSVVGAGCSVGPGARVAGSVLMDGVAIAEGACVEDSIVGHGATLGSRCSVTELSVVGPGASLAAGCAVVSDRVPGPDEWEIDENLG